jgi:hypothetical protein
MTKISNYSTVVVSLTEPAVLSNVASVDKSLIKSVNSSTLHTSNPNLQQASAPLNTTAVAGVKAASSTGFINAVAGGGGTAAKNFDWQTWDQCCGFGYVYPGSGSASKNCF